MLAIDQVDALIDELVGRSAADAAQARPLADVATGLMALRDVAHRTLTIVSCLPESWEYIRKYGVDTVTDRFREARQLRNIPSADVGRLMIEKRFAVDFGRAGFEPPYPTWPILPAAFDDASKYTARALLKRIEAHVARCLQEQAIAELDHLDEAPAGPQPAMAGGAAESPGLAALDRLFARLTEQATVGAALEPETEDASMPPLLAAGLEAWARELGGADDQAFVQEPLPGKNPRLHACLRMLLDTRTERQRRWAFRAIASNSPRAVQTRLRKAIEGAGLAAGGVGDAGRRLFVLRSAGWPTGPVTEKAAAEFTAKGGTLLPVSEADLRTFAALGELLAGHHPELNAWLLARRPAHNTELLGRALADADARPRLTRPRTPAPTLATPRRAPIGPPGRRPSAAPTDGPTRPRRVPARPSASASRPRASRKRPSTSPPSAATWRSSPAPDPARPCCSAGSSRSARCRASRRSSSTPTTTWPAWPTSGPPLPAPWLDGDAERARDYLAGTDVVLWTPRRESGRPLTFQPLPDFGAVLDDVDEFNAAVDAAVEALAPRVGVHRASTRAAQEKAVLTEAMRWFGRGAGHDLGVFIDLLSALPEHVTEIAKGPLLAAELADRMRAVRATDPLFGGAGEPADPGTLLTPPPGKRARISVISSVGMASLEQWQGFVNQLQMALFSWVKRNPAEDRPLGGLLVMDEAQDLVPSVGTTACSESTRRLASQARKYGLGLLFATQSPKSLHNSIPGNATTQLFGLLSSPVQIGAARELAWAKGGSLPDIGRLSSGQFYLATEGSAFRQIRTPMCLSYHPSTPLTEEEVLSRAAAR